MLYTKTINDRQVFDSCKTIQMPNGQWVSNPSAEQIEEAGWSVYTPPAPEPIEPTPLTEPDIYTVIDAVKKMLSHDAETLSDNDAVSVAALFPTWSSRIGSSISVGERVWYDGKLYKAIQAHTVQSGWTPDITAALYTEVSIVSWPDFVQPTGSENAYMSGDRVTYNGNHYLCVMDYNVYAPDVYPAGWEQQD